MPLRELLISSEKLANPETLRFVPKLQRLLSKGITFNVSTSHISLISRSTSTFHTVLGHESASA